MNKTFDRYASLVFFVLGISFVIGSLGISKSSYGSNVGPNIFPMGLGALLVLLSLRLFYESFQYMQNGQDKKKLDYKKFGVILAAAIIYALIFETLGYVISTFLFLLVGFQAMEKGRWLHSILYSALFSIGVYYLYVDILDGTLPGLPSWIGL